MKCCAATGVIVGMRFRTAAKLAVEGPLCRIHMAQCLPGDMATCGGLGRDMKRKPKSAEVEEGTLWAHAGMPRGFRVSFAHSGGKVHVRWRAGHEG